MDAPSTRPPPGTSVPVWDRIVRGFHWGLVACVLANRFVLEAGEAPHRWTGYAACALVLARTVWGFVGSRHARFADFWPHPRRVMAHLRALARGTVPHHLGHNPLGALMMLALMGLVLALGATGWMQGTDRFFGVEWVQDLHETLANSLLVLAALHALAALAMGRLERTHLVRAMVTGRKRFD